MNSRLPYNITGCYASGHFNPSLLIPMERFVLHPSLSSTFRRGLPCLVLAALTGVLGAAGIVVSPSGRDSDPGTRDQPVASLHRAQELAREALRRTAEEPLTVTLEPGVYRLSEALLFTPEDGGSESRSVTWQAAAPGTVRISGGVLLTGWQVGTDGVWQLKLPDAFPGPAGFRELFINGERRPRARHPNDGYFRIVEAAADRRTGFEFAPGDVVAVPDIEQVELVFLHDWSVSRIRLLGIDAESNTLTTANPIGANASHYAIDHFEKHPRYYLENSRRYLDQPGEWHLDARARTVTYLPLPGESPESVEVVVPQVERLVEVRGEPGRPVQNLHFVGLHFEHCAWTLPRNGYAEGQANFHEPRTETQGILREIIPAAIHFELAEGCSVRDSQLAHLGGCGLWFGSRCHNNALVNTRVTDLSGNGVLVGEGSGRLVNGKQWWQAAPDEAARHNLIRDCTIERCGRQFFGAVGVWVGFTCGTRILHNEIRHLPYTGVSLGWMWNPTPTPNRENLVEANHIHHVMQVLSDGAGIYTLGRQPGTVLRRNLIHDVPLNAGRAESNGMFLDEGTTDIVIEENAIWNIERSPLRFHKASTNRVRNNLLVVRGDLPHIRYNNTRPEDIRQEGNTLAKEAEPK
jgi:hypothetical protein